MRFIRKTIWEMIKEECENDPTITEVQLNEREWAALKREKPALSGRQMRMVLAEPVAMNSMCPCSENKPVQIREVLIRKEECFF